MDRREITFEQAEGIEALPTQLQTGQISQEMRAKLWRTLYVYLDSSREKVDYRADIIGDPWLAILRTWHVDREHKLFDEFDERFDEVVAKAKTLVQRGSYAQTLGFIQFIIRHRRCPPDFAENIDHALRSSRAAYCVIENTIMPISEPEEVASIKENLAIARGSPFHGAFAHLRQAMSEISSGNSAAAIRESIHAVESACKQLEPEASTLGPALRKLDDRTLIHPSMKEAFSKLYGYTSDEEGVRHALVMKDAASVDEADALFMFSACAAFVGYLTRKSH